MTPRLQCPPHTNPPHPYPPHSYDNTSNAPHNAEECRHEIFNFFLEFPDWKQFLEQLEEISKFKNISEELQEGLQNISDVSFLPCQNVLFDLPLYYIGK